MYGLPLSYGLKKKEENMYCLYVFCSRKIRIGLAGFWYYTTKISGAVTIVSYIYILKKDPNLKFLV